MSEVHSGSLGGRSVGDWEALARSAAEAREGGHDLDLLRELLTFDLSGAPYAIPVERVREIVRLKSITPMPRVPRSVLGVIALRGEIVQVVDLRMRLNLATPEPTRATRVVVLHGDDDRVTGVLVDRVREVLRVSEEEVRPVANAESSLVSELCMRGDDFVSIIDLDRVLEIDAGT